MEICAYVCMEICAYVCMYMCTYVYYIHPEGLTIIKTNSLAIFNIYPAPTADIVFEYIPEMATIRVPTVDYKDHPIHSILPCFPMILVVVYEVMQDF